MSETGDGDTKSFVNIDRLVHEPARLTILAHLYVVESADFLFLMSQTDLTWGNLSSHLSKLEAAGYIEIEKKFKGKKPNTMLKITDKGRSALLDYREKMKRALDQLPE